MRNCSFKEGEEQVPYIREIFFRMFVGIFKKYNEFINQGKPNTGKYFDKVKFEEQLNKGYKPFVKQFMETQIFQKFLEGKVNPQKNEEEFLSIYFDEKIISKANRAFLAKPKVTSIGD